MILMAMPAPQRTRGNIETVLRRMPQAEGSPIRLLFKPSLMAYRGKLLSENATGRGHAVHAAAFLRKRRIVMETALLRDRRELSRILVHELFHFVWVRLGNPLRRSFEQVLVSEMEHRSKGELGWSAEVRKQQLNAHDWTHRTRAWREYVCESFCDTAAWLYSGSGQHPEYTLALRFRAQRRRWMLQTLATGTITL
jgi:hypothetical protein